MCFIDIGQRILRGFAMSIETGQMHQFLSLAHVLGCSKQALQFIPDIGEYEYFLYYSAPGKDNYYKQNQMKIWKYFMIHFHLKKKEKKKPTPK